MLHALAFTRSLTTHTNALRVQTGNSRDPKTTRTIEYDIVGAPQADFSFAVTFPFHPSPAGGQVTIIREYSQGANDLLFNLPTGTSPSHPPLRIRTSLGLA